jgi:hypothetical protein
LFEIGVLSTAGKTQYNTILPGEEINGIYLSAQEAVSYFKSLYQIKNENTTNMLPYGYINWWIHPSFLKNFSLSICYFHDARIC